MSKIPHIKLERNAMCPCGSGKKTKKCLLLANSIHPLHVNVLPPGPRTGFTNPGCYLSRLDDCSAKLTREHFQSATLLRNLMGKSAIVSGNVDQLPGEVCERGIKAMAAKVLCKRHNESLATLDSAADRLLMVQMQLARLTTRENPIKHLQNFHILINGHDIERWAIKSLIGMIAANAIRINDKLVKNYPIEDEWVQILMGEHTIKSPLGLYFRCDRSDDTGRVTPILNDYGTRVLWDKNTTKILGLEIRLMSTDYVLWLDKVQRHPFQVRPDLGFLAYRCPYYYGRREHLCGTLEFAWDIKGSSSVEQSRPLDFPPPGHRFNSRWHHYGETFEKTWERYKELNQVQ